MSTVGTAAGQKPSAAGNIIAILAQRRDLALVALLFGIVFLMIIPMPTWLVDTLPIYCTTPQKILNCC